MHGAAYSKLSFSVITVLFEKSIGRCRSATFPLRRVLVWEILRCTWAEHCSDWRHLVNGIWLKWDWACEWVEGCGSVAGALNHITLSDNSVLIVQNIINMQLKCRYQTSTVEGLTHPHISPLLDFPLIPPPCLLIFDSSQPWQCTVLWLYIQQCGVLSVSHSVHITHILHTDMSLGTGTLQSICSW